MKATDMTGAKSYIAELRGMIGNWPVIMVGTSVVVLHAQRILMQQRSDNGRWSCPGGMLEPGETVEEAARRELLEETGVDSGEFRLVGVASGPACFYRYPNGHEVHNVTVIFETQLAAEPILRADKESTILGWFPIDHLPEDLSPPTIEILKVYAASRAESATRGDSYA